MPKLQKSKRVAPAVQTTISRLFVLNACGGRIFSVNPDGSNQINIVTNGKTLSPGGGSSVDDEREI
jgi:hypothetical protein